MVTAVLYDFLWLVFAFCVLICFNIAVVYKLKSMVKIEKKMLILNIKLCVCLCAEMYAYVCVCVHLQEHEQRRTLDRPCSITFCFIPLSQCLPVNLAFLKFG